MAILTPISPALTGTTKALAAAAAGGDSFPNTGIEMLEIQNAHAANPRTVTADSPATCSLNVGANAAHDVAVVVPALTTLVIGPFPKNRFNDTNGRVQLTYSDSAADLTVVVIKPS